jgi:ribosome-binding factor A
MAYRLERINGEMQKVIADIIENKVRNPQKTEMVSVMRVDVAKDLKTAKVLLSVYGDKERANATFEAIVRSAGFIRRELSNNFSELRTVPSLIFLRDESLNYSAKIETILEEIKSGNDNQSN